MQIIDAITNKTMPTDREAPLEVPFTVIVDGREKRPYAFEGLRADARDLRRPLVVKTEWGHLPTGDYSIAGMEGRVCVERKSLAGLYGSLGQHRERFKREHQRMAEMDFAAVVVEADLRTILNNPPAYSKLPPKCVFRTALAWQVRHGVGWIWAGSRRLAEVTTFRLLERFWREQQDKEPEPLETIK